MASDVFGILLAANIPALMGSVFYVDPADGLDSYDGSTPARGFKTLTAGYAALTENTNDTLVLIGNDASVAKLTETLDWAKNYTHLIGACAPVGVSQRARIFGHADNNDVTPLILVSASGCSFRNIYVNYGVDDAGCLEAVEVTGSRNYFENCHFAGIGHATQDAALACSLKITGASECRFVHCSIGSDTQHTRGADNSEILVSTRASKMFFEDCYIYAWISAGGHSLVKTEEAAAMTGTWLFKNCIFESMIQDNATPMDVAFDIHINPETLYLILANCVGVHISAWAAALNKTYVANLVTTAGTDGMGVLL